MRLVFHSRPTPRFDEMGELLREQLGPLLEQAEGEGEGGEELIQLFTVCDESGRHLYDLHLFCGDEGQLLKAGTTQHVASFSQGEATGSRDEHLLKALRAALAEWRGSHESARS